MSSQPLKNDKPEYKRIVIAATALGAFLLAASAGPASARAQESSAPQATAQAAQDQQAASTSPEDPAMPAASVSSAPVVQAPKPAKQNTPFAIGVGVKASILGIGAEVAVPVTRKTNLRIGYNQFNYSRTLTSDGISYGGNLDFRSLDLLYDWFPFGGKFHLSPGLLAYNGNQVKANASVPAGQTFTLNHVDYTSDPSNPITGTGKLVMGHKAAPMFLFGFGNLAPRHGHFSVSLEMGAAFTGAPSTTLNLTGNACDSFGVCASTSSSTLQANIQAEQAKLNHDVSSFKVFPVLSLGFGYKF